MTPFEFGYRLKVATQTASGLPLRDHSSSCGTPDDEDESPMSRLMQPTKATAKPVLVNSRLKRASIGASPLLKQPATPGPKPTTPAPSLKPAAPAAISPKPAAPSLPASPAAPPAPRPTAPAAPPMSAAPAAPITPGGDSMQMMDRAQTAQAAGDPLSLMKMQRDRPLLVDRENINMAAGNRQGTGLPGGGYVSRPAAADPNIRAQARQEMASYNASGGPMGSLGGSADRVGKMRALAAQQQAPAAQPTAFSQMPQDQKWMQVRQSLANDQARVAQTRALRQQQNQVAQQNAAQQFPTPLTAAEPVASASPADTDAEWQVYRPGSLGTPAAPAAPTTPGAAGGTAGGASTPTSPAPAAPVPQPRPTAPAAPIGQAASLGTGPATPPRITAAPRAPIPARQPGSLGAAPMPGGIGDLSGFFNKANDGLMAAGQAGARGDRGALGGILKSLGIGGGENGQPQVGSGISMEQLPQLLKMFGLDRLFGNAA